MSSVAIRSIEFENYRCLKKARLEFGPLTVLVGGNGTGKTSVLRALTWDQSGLNKDDVTGQSPHHSAELRVAHRSGQTKVAWNRGSGVSSSGPVPGARQLLHLELKALRTPVQLEAARVLSADGLNMANVLASLSRVFQRELSERFCALIPLYADVDFQPVSQGHLTLRFQDRWSKVWYLPKDVSDGTMLVLAYLLLLHQEPQVDLIAIEEPERGLHPYLLGQLVQFLRAMAQGKIGDRAVQIVAATHSAEFLNHLEPDEVRFLSRDNTDGSTLIETVQSDTPDWRRAFTEYDSALGSMWLSGGLGGVPGR
jgi:predicted ATPase